jgi:hypothetical protein
MPDSTATPSEIWRRRLTGGFAAISVLVVFYAAMLASVRDKSATMDEFRHATAGYTYWKFNDYRLDPENGNLSKRWTALALLAGSNPFPTLDSPKWKESSSGEIADDWFNETGDAGIDMLKRGRAMSALWAVALGAIVWVWSRRLFGPLGGMLSLLLYVLSPIVLANGPLMTSDAPAAFFFLLSAWCFDGMLRRLSPARVLASAGALAGLFLAKMSAIIIVPALLVVAFVRVFDRQPLAGPAHRELRTRWQKAGALAAAAMIHAVVVITGVWAAHGFRFSAFTTPDARFHQPWEWVLDKTDPVTLLQRVGLTVEQAQKINAILAARGAAVPRWTRGALAALPEIEAHVLTPAQTAAFERSRAEPPAALSSRLLLFARDRRLLPEAYLYGYAHVLRMSLARGAFLNGEISLTGWRKFFPFVFAVKTPLASLALFLLAGIVLVWQSRRAPPLAKPHVSPGVAWRDLALLLGLLVTYWAVAIASSVNIGHRHLLPVYPPLFVLAGAVCLPLVEAANARGSFSWLSGRGRMTIVGILMAALGAEVAARYPNYLAYFNGLISPSRAYRHLVDSSLDWGQDLPAVKRYIDAHPEEGPFSIAYFGPASLLHHGVRARVAFLYPDIVRTKHSIIASPAGAQPNADDPRLAKFLRDHPEYDSAFVDATDFAGRPRAILVKKAAALRLEPGTYFISASLLTFLFYHNVGLGWHQQAEDTYQQLRVAVAPLFSDDHNLQVATLRNQPLGYWQTKFLTFEELRFARLIATLREREPSGNINHSILIYRLTPDDLDRALNGPPPFTSR